MQAAAGAPANPVLYGAFLQQLLTNGPNGGPLVVDMLHNFGVNLKLSQVPSFKSFNSAAANVSQNVWVLQQLRSVPVRFDDIAAANLAAPAPAWNANVDTQTMWWTQHGARLLDRWAHAIKRSAPDTGAALNTDGKRLTHVEVMDVHASALLGTVRAHVNAGDAVAASAALIGQGRISDLIVAAKLRVSAQPAGAAAGAAAG